ncbi:hypothetical protein [Sinosporangium album]|nr:hypothetical protein [Sinosporangium album]
MAATAHASSVIEVDPPERLFEVIGGRITEASGLALSEDGERFYTIPDAGGPAEVYVFGKKGETTAILTLPTRDLNEDWEDIAVVKGKDGRRHIYLADTGDAWFVRRDKGMPNRTEYRLLKFPEPDPSVKGETPVTDVITYTLAYADGGSHNSEAVAVHPRTGQVFFIAKTEKAGAPVRAWSAPATLSQNRTNTLRQIHADLRVQGASGASFSPTGDRLVVRNATHAYVWWIKNSDVAASLRAKPITVELPTQRQGEGIAFTIDGQALLVNSEGSRQAVWKVPLPSEAGAREDTDKQVGASLPPTLAEPAPGTGDNDLLMIIIALVAGTGGLGLLTYHLVRARRTTVS